MYTTDLIVGFEQAGASLESVGGKGLNLIRLTRTGLSVPPGFVVTTAAYQQLLQASHLDDRVRQILSTLSQDLATASAQIREAFDAADLPEALKAQIVSSYRDVCVRTGQTDLPVAVRSSATAEDLSEASFAGQQDTYLNIRGEQALLDAVKRCFASLWSERAMNYRARQAIPPMEARLAVVIQQMVFADASGVLFTANPLSGDHNHLVIDATWGLGEALVSGLVTPDHILVDKRTGKVLVQTVADKTTMIVSTADGTQERPVPPLQRHARVLKNTAIASLVQVGKQIEQVYDRPMDIEWCQADHKIMIVQARPITTLPAVPISWDAPGKGQWLHGGGTFEMITEPISPLFETSLLPTFYQSIMQMLDGIGLKDALPEVPYRIVNGFIYLHMAMRLRPWHLVGVLRDFGLHLNSMKDQETEQTIYRQAVEQLSQVPATERSNADLLEAIDALGQAAMRYWLQIMKIVQVIYRREKRFSDFYARQVRQEGDPEAEVFLRGQKILPWEAECSTFALAQLARNLPDVADILLTNNPDVLSLLKQNESGQRFLAALDQHLSRYGHQLASFDLRLPTLADDPRPVIGEVVAFLNGKESPGDRQQRLVQEREQALAIVSRRLSPRTRQEFLRLLSEAQSAARVREDAVFQVGLAWTPMHRFALNLGSRLEQAGVIASPEDIFWLRLEEIRSIVGVLEGKHTVESLAHVVDERQFKETQWSKVEAPYLLPVDSRPGFWWGWIFPTPELQRHPDAHTLIGLGVSPGKVTATARVIRRLEDANELNPGEILVAHTTTPAWTPIFAKAAGLVTDLGGPLAHGSIVAREYDIPAVMGTGNATRKIQSGQTITVYGSEGRVLLT